MPIGSTLVCPNISCPWRDPHDEFSSVHLSSAKAVHSKKDEFSGDFQIGWGWGFKVVNFSENSSVPECTAFPIHIMTTSGEELAHWRHRARRSSPARGGNSQMENNLADHISTSSDVTFSCRCFHPWFDFFEVPNHH